MPRKDDLARTIIRESLRELAIKLGSIEQTTQGFIGEADILRVCSSLAIAYQAPTAFNISNLSNHIYALTDSD